MMFRVFISSTFADLSSERDALQQHVFPALREYCELRGARFQAIDLRWGVNEEAALDQSSMDICLEEIARCQRTTPRPNFVILLGDRYGWRPLPSAIPEAEFEEICNRLGGDDLSALTHWYRRDENAIPAEYDLQPRKGEFRDPEGWSRIERRLRLILSSGTRELDLSTIARLKYEASATEQEVVRGALTVQEAEAHVFCFFRSIAGLPQDATAGHFRDLDPHGRPDLDARKRLERLKEKIRQRLPGNVHEYHADWNPNGPTLDHLPLLCGDVKERLASVIRQEIDRLATEDPVTRERHAHTHFAQAQSELFIGRDLELKAIHDYVAGGARGLALMVVGEPGSGRTALLARAFEQTRGKIDADESQPSYHPMAPVWVGESKSARDDYSDYWQFPCCGQTVRRAEDGPPPPSPGCRFESMRDAVVLARFVGATPASTAFGAMVESVCHEIARAYGHSAPAAREFQHDYRGLVEAWRNHLALASGRRPLILYLDALDHVFASSREVSLFIEWELAALPSHVRVIASVDADQAFAAHLQDSHATAAGWGGFYVGEGDPGPFPSVDVRDLSVRVRDPLLTAWLERVHRTLRSDQKEAILANPASAGPLSLKLAFEEARRWRSWHQSTEAVLPGGVEELIRERVLPRLESSHGPVLVRRSVGYLAAARHGLFEDDLIDILSADHEIVDEFVRRAWHTAGVMQLPTVIWSRLYSDLDPYLREQEGDAGNLLALANRQFRDAVKDVYLAGTSARDRHTELSAYFRNRAESGEQVAIRHEALAYAFRSADHRRQLEERPEAWSGPRHALEEFPYHLAEAGRARDAVAVLLDDMYLMNRLDLTSDDGFLHSRHQLRQDFDLITLAFPVGDEPDDLCNALHALMRLGFSMLVGEWDKGKLLLKTTLETARDAALIRPDLARCFAALLDSIGRLFKSQALFEGLRGEYSGWTLFNTARACFDDVVQLAEPVLPDWVADWERAWSGLPR